jgi:peptidoglycan/xylan/chitin deacetylase (PgdA/CDA1 family)
MRAILTTRVGRLRSAAVRWARARPAKPGDAVVLVYHRVADLDSDPGGLAVSPKRFAEHLQAIRESFRSLSLGSLVAGIGAGAVPSGSVVVTFDDGYADNLVEARPLLERHQVPATVFVVSGYVASGRRFWWDELERICLSPSVEPSRLELPLAGRARTRKIDDRADRRAVFRMMRGDLGPLEARERDELLAELRARAGIGPADGAETLSADQLRQLADSKMIEIGAHTISHPRLPEIPRARQLDEIRGSATQLEELLERDVRLFSYPFGAYDRTTVACAKEASLACACTTVPDSVRASADPYRLPRLYVGDWPAEELVRQLSARLR